MFDLNQLLIALVVTIAIFLLLREFYCWYFKINEINKKLDRMVELLAKSRGGDGVEDDGKVEDLSDELYLLLNHSRPLWLQGIDLGKQDLSGIDLTKANLQNAYLAGTMLKGANLTDANLWGASISGTDFSKANLSGDRLWLHRNPRKGV